MKHRILAMMLAVAMTFNSVPVTASAEESEAIAEVVEETETMEEETVEETSNEEIVETPQVPEEKIIEESEEDKMADPEIDEETGDLSSEELAEDISEEILVEVTEESQVEQFATGEEVSETAEITCTASPTKTVVKKDGTGEDALTLTAAFSITGLEEEEVSYQWYSCDSAGEKVQEVSSADATTLTIPNESAGTFYYYCEASATVDETTISAKSDAAKVVVTECDHIKNGTIYRTSSTATLENDGYEWSGYQLTLENIYVNGGIYDSSSTAKTIIVNDDCFIDAEKLIDGSSINEINFKGSKTLTLVSDESFYLGASKLTLTDGVTVKVQNGYASSTGELEVTDRSVLVVNTDKQYAVRASGGVYVAGDDSAIIINSNYDGASGYGLYSDSTIKVEDNGTIDVDCSGAASETGAVYAYSAITVDRATLKAVVKETKLLRGYPLTYTNAVLASPEGGSIMNTSLSQKVIDVRDQNGTAVSSILISPSTDPYLKLLDQSDAVLTGVEKDELTLSFEVELRNPVDSTDYKLQWYSCDVRGENRAAIAGATKSTLTVCEDRGVYHYVCVAAAEGAENLESQVMAVVLSAEGKTVVSSGMDMSYHAMETTDKLAEEGWSWDEGTSTLTLDNFTGVNPETGIPITVPDDSTIILKGKNILYLDNDYTAAPIYGKGDLTILSEEGGTVSVYTNDWVVQTQENLVLDSTEIHVESRSARPHFLCFGENLTMIGCKVASPVGADLLGSGNSWYFRDSAGNYLASAVIKPMTDPYIRITESPETAYQADISNLPMLTLKAQVENSEEQPQVIYQWYQCDGLGANRVLVGTGSSYPVKAENGRNYYVGVASGEGLAAVETRLITVDLAKSGKQVVNSRNALTDSTENIDNLDTEGWSWDFESKILTLQEFTGIRNRKDAVNSKYEIFELPAGTTIIVKGDNYINSYNAFVAKGNLTICEDSETEGTLDFDYYVLDSSVGMTAIKAAGDVQIKDITLNANGYGTVVDQSDTSNTTLTIDSANIIANGCNTMFEAKYDSGNIDINQSAVTLSVDYNYGFYCNTLTITNSAVEISTVETTAIATNSLVLKNQAVLKAANQGDNYYDTGHTINTKTLNLGTGCVLTASCTNRSALKIYGTESESAKIDGTLYAASGLKGAVYSKTAPVYGDGCVMVTPDGGTYNSSTYYIVNASGGTAKEVSILEGGLKGTVSSVGAINGELHAGGSMKAGNITIKVKDAAGEETETNLPSDATVSYQWKYMIPGNNIWHNFSGQTSDTINWKEMYNPSSYVGYSFKVTVKGTGFYDGTAESEAVVLQGDPAKIAQITINGAAAEFNPDQTVEAGKAVTDTLEVGFKEKDADIRIETNDPATVVKINGIERTSYYLSSLEEAERLEITVTCGEITSTYNIPVKKAEPPETSKLKLSIENLTSATRTTYDKLIADWVAPDGTTGSVELSVSPSSKSVDVPYGSKVRIYTPHNDSNGTRSDIVCLYLENTDTDPYDYTLPEVKSGVICGCDECDNAYEFVMDKGDVCYLLKPTSYAFKAPEVAASWNTDGGVNLTVTMPNGSTSFPSDTHQTITNMKMEVTTESGSPVELLSMDNSTCDSILTFTSLSEEGPHAVLKSTLDPNLTYIVKTYYTNNESKTYLPEEYRYTITKIGPRADVSIEPVTFVKNLLDKDVDYDNGIITLAYEEYEENKTYELKLSYAGDNTLASAVVCAPESDDSSVVEASYSCENNTPILKLTTKGTGTAYVSMNLSLFGNETPLVWRVNVVDESESYAPKLETKSVTWNPAMSTYSKIQVLTSAHDASGTHIWKFENHAKAEMWNDCFTLVQIDSQTLEIRPNWDKINEYGGLSKLPSSAKVQLSMDDKMIPEFLSLKLTKTLPTVKAGNVTLNSFYSQAEQAITLTSKGNVITKVAIDTSKESKKDYIYGKWIDFRWDSKEAKAYVAVTENNVKAKGKLYLNVWLNGYEIPVTAAVSVSASPTVPKLKLSASTLTLTAAGTDIPMQLLSGNKKTAYADMHITDIRTATEEELGKLSAKEQKSYAITSSFAVAADSEIAENGEFLLRLQKGKTAESGKILLYAIVGNDEAQKVPLTITIKVDTKASTVKFEKSSITLDRTLGDGAQVQTVKFITSHVNREILYSPTITILDKKGADASDKLEVTFNRDDRSISVSTKEGCLDGTYKVSLKIYGIAKAAQLTVKAASKVPTLVLKSKSMNIDTMKGGNTGTTILTSKTAGYETLDESQIYLVLKKGNVILAKGMTEVANDKVKVSVQEAEDGATQIVVTPLIICNESYKVEISYNCPNGETTKAVTLSVSLKAKIPTITLTDKSMTLNTAQLGQTFYVKYTLSNGKYGTTTADKKNGIIFNIVDTSTGKTAVSKNVTLYRSTSDKYSGTCEITTKSLKAGGKYTLSVYWYDLNAGIYGKAATMKLNVAEEGKIPSMSISLKNTMDLSKTDTGSITITPKYTNFANTYASDAASVGFRIYAKDGKNPLGFTDGYMEEDGKLSGKWFNYAGNEEGTYTLKINTDEDSAYAKNLFNANYKYTIYPVITVGTGDTAVEYIGKGVTFTIKQSTLKLSQSAKTITLCTADKYDREYIRLTPTGTDAAAIRDVQLASGSAAGYEVKYYGNGLCAICFKENQPASKKGTVKLNIFTDGVTDDAERAAKVKPNATVSVSVKLVSAE